MKLPIGIFLALAIGAACRFAGVPLPAPPAFVGAFLVFAMTLGFVVTDEVKKKLDDKAPRKKNLP